MYPATIGSGLGFGGGLRGLGFGTGSARLHLGLPALTPPAYRFQVLGRIVLGGAIRNQVESAYAVSVTRLCRDHLIIKAHTDSMALRNCASVGSAYDTMRCRFQPM